MNKHLLSTLLTSLLVVVFAAPGALATHHMEMVIERESPLSFEATIEKLIANAKAVGWKVPKKWRKNFYKNFKRAAKTDIGGEATVIEMCEPKAGARLMVHDKYKRFLSMMPCTVAVYEKSDGKVYLSMMNIRMMADLYKEEQPIQEMVTELAPQMEQMLIME